MFSGSSPCFEHPLGWILEGRLHITAIDAETDSHCFGETAGLLGE